MGKRKGSGKKHRGKGAAQPEAVLHPLKEFTLEVDQDKFPESFKKLIHDVREYLRTVVEDEMKKLPKKHRKPVTINGKIYTPAGGAFIIRLVGSKGVVCLLVRMKDLYLEAFHFDGVWFRLNDALEALPPTTQLKYGDTKKKGIPKEGVFTLPWGTSYLEVPGAVPMFNVAFEDAHGTLCGAITAVGKKTTHRVLGPPIKLYARISECIRFGPIERFTIASTRPHVVIPRLPPKKVGSLINQWKKRSSRMYCENPPQSLIDSIEVIKRIPKRHKLLREKPVYQKRMKLLSSATNNNITDKKDTAAAKGKSILMEIDEIDVESQADALLYEDESGPSYIQLPDDDDYNYDDDDDDDDDEEEQEGDDDVDDDDEEDEEEEDDDEEEEEEEEGDDDASEEDGDACHNSEVIYDACSSSYKGRAKFASDAAPAFQNDSALGCCDDRNIPVDDHAGPFCDEDALIHEKTLYGEGAEVIPLQCPDDAEYIYNDNGNDGEEEGEAADDAGPFYKDGINAAIVGVMDAIAAECPDDAEYIYNDNGNDGEEGEEVTDDAGPCCKDGINAAIVDVKDAAELILQGQEPERQHQEIQQLDHSKCQESEEYSCTDATKYVKNPGKIESDATEYPKRPCIQYLRKGSCMYMERCKFDHPADRLDTDAEANVEQQAIRVNRDGLPIRKGVENCINYARNGTCKRREGCKFNHPSPRKKLKSKMTKVKLLVK